ncbi:MULTISPECIES: ATP-binding cassette domain-containing protein [unclassified Enterococcus]|uniref:methionine ABC transporter ATP-binding protein n=1 Tax=unclassified Enterococcus TaxID=2608891 RepID=UPI0024731EF5|nr:MULTISPECIES: ATP-binding cassette domain-containing protein [unclassified Enterococcus]
MAFIELNNIVKQFAVKNKEVTAVNGVSLTIEQGDVYGIVGYSGAGKSTLVRLLNGLELPTSGDVIIQGENIATFSQSKLRNFRKKVGMIFQHFNLLWSRTVLENIELPLELAGVAKSQRKERALELLDLVGLQGRGDAYPAQLSGGQKQRVGIARALANNPDILLCDEATSALDPQTTDEVLELLAKINRELNLTIILITHEMHVVRKICNKVAVMELGSVVESGSVSNVFRNPQQAVTKRFVQQELQPETDDQALIAAFIANNPEGKIITLEFKENNASEAVISKIIRKFPVDVNIVAGQIQQANGAAFGTLTILLTGETQAIQAVIAYLHQEEVGVLEYEQE